MVPKTKQTRWTGVADDGPAPVVSKRRIAEGGLNDHHVVVVDTDIDPCGRAHLPLGWVDRDPPSHIQVRRPNTAVRMRSPHNSKFSGTIEISLSPGGVAMGAAT